MAAKPRLLFLVSEDWYFCSHRLALAIDSLAAGYDVVVVTRVRDHGEIIRRAGLRLIHCEISRRGINPLSEALSVLKLARIYAKERPLIVHHVAFKPIVLGSLAARLSRVPHIVNAVAGLGYVFTSEKLKARLLRPFLRWMLRNLMCQPNSHTIFQNPDDQATIIEWGINRNNCLLVRGTGVDLEEFSATAEVPDTPKVLLAARMLWDKGVGTFVEAVAILRSRKLDFRAILVGRPDSGNPASIPETQLRQWHENGAIEWWGHVEGMPTVLSGCHVVCLPSSYGEGIPKVLIEAAACARPIVASDVSGCREIVKHEINGFLVPPRNAGALADALQCLIEDPALREKFGTAGRLFTEKEFSLRQVNDAILGLYSGGPPPSRKIGASAI